MMNFYGDMQEMIRLMYNEPLKKSADRRETELL